MTGGVVRPWRWVSCLVAIAALCVFLVARAERTGSSRYNGIGALGPFAWHEQTGVTYATPANGSSLDTVNICKPLPVSAPWAGPYPAILLIHGGGWSSGTNAIGTTYTGTSSAWCQIWASWGFVAYSVGYRLQNGEPGNAWPAQLVDVQAAVRWVRARAATANPDHVNPALIGAMGDSAGGSLAMQLGSLPSNVENADDPVTSTHAGQSPLVQFVISAFGPIHWGPSSPNAPLPNLTIANAQSGERPSDVAGSLFIQGTQDRTVRAGESIAAYCLLKSRDMPANYLSYVGDHEFSGFPGSGWVLIVGRLITGAISFAVTIGHQAGAIPTSFVGPRTPFNDPVPPVCS